MAIGIQRIAESSSVVSERSRDTVSEAKIGDTSIKQTKKQMDTINQAVASLAQTIHNLDEKSVEINNILKVITDITEQTNLLALNAAIEAARAGEHGKGFSVVANEVRNLAEQSKTSAAEITRIIDDIQKGTKDAKLAMDRGKQEVDNGLQTVQQTEGVLKSILTYAEEVSSQIIEVSAVAEQLSASSEEVSATVDEMANVSKTSSDNTKQVATHTDAQMDSIDEIEDVTNSLQKLSKDLDELIKSLKE
ncbi:methyl-accepting chemotaxis protein [Bacillus salinus]|uniref:methyl-accepting chemotaxis protein n=1 Tax=Bacillus sp. HMF5848 TaxID=2495421 RepID=UPI0037C04209